MIFCRDETFKKCFIANVNVYRYSNLLKTDNHLSANYCLVINGLKLNKIPYDVYYKVFSNTSL